MKTACRKLNLCSTMNDNASDRKLLQIFVYGWRFVLTLFINLTAIRVATIKFTFARM